MYFTHTLNFLLLVILLIMAGFSQANPEKRPCTNCERPKLSAKTPL
uniref:2 kDa salivary protein n=1 Tax=Phlebotomus ariasi TaxID=59272 RepID=Q2TJC5_9DIPT|nr:2 kDa salivary protein [Phlebotomus ariasi]